MATQDKNFSLFFNGTTVKKLLHYAKSEREGLLTVILVVSQEQEKR